MVEPRKGKAVASRDDQSACIKRPCIRDQFLTQLHLWCSYTATTLMYTLWSTTLMYTQLQLWCTHSDLQLWCTHSYNSDVHRFGKRNITFMFVMTTLPLFQHKGKAYSRNLFKCHPTFFTLYILVLTFLCASLIDAFDTKFPTFNV